MIRAESNGALKRIAVGFRKGNLDTRHRLHQARRQRLEYGSLAGPVTKGDGRASQPQGGKRVVMPQLTGDDHVRFYLTTMPVR